jgi:hypothetical protein
MNVVHNHQSICPDVKLEIKLVRLVTWHHLNTTSSSVLTYPCIHRIYKKVRIVSMKGDTNAWCFFSRLERGICMFSKRMLIILKGHWNEKNISNKHLGRCLRPSIWTANIFNNFLILRLKYTIFKTVFHAMLKRVYLWPRTADKYISGPGQFQMLWAT